eukprot:jgi/Botrbrau1/7242/Bobra.0021s0025.1
MRWIRERQDRVWLIGVVLLAYNLKQTHGERRLLQTSPPPPPPPPGPSPPPPPPAPPSPPPPPDPVITGGLNIINVWENDTIFLQSLDPFAPGGSQGPPRKDDRSISSMQTNLIVDSPLVGTLEATVIQVATWFPGSSWTSQPVSGFVGRKLLRFQQGGWGSLPLNSTSGHGLLASVRGILTPGILVNATQPQSEGGLQSQGRGWGSVQAVMCRFPGFSARCNAVTDSRDSSFSA